MLFFQISQTRHVKKALKLTTDVRRSVKLIADIRKTMKAAADIRRSAVNPRSNPGNPWAAQYSNGGGIHIAYFKSVKQYSINT